MVPHDGQRWAAKGSLESAASCAAHVGQYEKAGIVVSNPPRPDNSERSNGAGADQRQGDAKLACILFDLDGTLIDTTDLIFRSYRHAYLAELGEDLTDEALFLGYGRPLPEAFTSILQYRQVQQEPAARQPLIDRLITVYREFNVSHHDVLAREFPGVQATIHELRQRGYTLGLVTSKARGIAERGLKLICLGDAFDAAIFMEDTELHKPHPDPLWAALDRLVLRHVAQQVLYVGDSTHDLQAGRAAGMQTAGALWGPFPPDSLKAEQPDYLLPSVSALLELCPSRMSSISGS